MHFAYRDAECHRLAADEKKRMIRSKVFQSGGSKRAEKSGMIREIQNPISTGESDMRD